MLSKTKLERTQYNNVYFLSLYSLVVFNTINAHFVVCVFIQKFKQIFEEGLELQKAHLREQRAYTKELRQENYRKYKDEIEAVENYYRDQVKTAFINVLTYCTDCL